MLVNRYVFFLLLSILKSTIQNFETLYRLQQIETILYDIKDQMKKITNYTENAKVENFCKTKKNNFPKNCQEILESGKMDDGIYTIRPDNYLGTLQVRCNMKTKDGGWIYVLNRFDGSQDFYKNWNDYRNGFGNLSGEFWLGLEPFHKITNVEDNEMLVELVDFDNKKAYAFYDYIKLDDEDGGYQIKILGRCRGDAGDSLFNRDFVKFTTRDRDQDKDLFVNCAQSMKAAWWYTNCYHGQLTGEYLKKTPNEKKTYEGLIWHTFRGFKYSLKEARILIRPVTPKSRDIFTL